MSSMPLHSSYQPQSVEQGVEFSRQALNQNIMKYKIWRSYVKFHSSSENTFKKYRQFYFMYQYPYVLSETIPTPTLSTLGHSLMILFSNDA